MADTYNIEDLNPNNLLSFEYQAAICYLTHQENEKAIHHLRKYAHFVSKLFADKELRLHGDNYFDSIEHWFDKELEMGTN